MQRILLIFLAAGLASGCMLSTGGAYPFDWAKPVDSADGCSMLDGEYANAGEMFRGQATGNGSYFKKPLSLAHLLAGWAELEHRSFDYYFAEPDAEADPYRTVSLQLTSESLRVVATRVEGDTHSFDLPVRAGCKDSLIALEPKSGFSTFILVTAGGRSTLELGRATDGSLLARGKDWIVGHYVLLPPMVGSDEIWARFPLAPASPAVEELAPVQVVLSPARTEMPPEGH